MNKLEMSRRMYEFAKSAECNPVDYNKVKAEADRLLSQHYKEWADSITESNPFEYEKVKHEKIHYIEGAPVVDRLKAYKTFRRRYSMTAREWIQRRKEAQYKRRLTIK